MNRVVNFGCRLNACEAGIIGTHLKDEGHNDTIVVNTCAVTAEAERQARQAVRRLRRDHPDATIVATGCAAEIDRDAWDAMPEIDRVVANSEKTRRGTWSTLRSAGVRDPDRVPALPAGRTRAFVEVQNGCDHHCTFCIIPRGRGASRSRPPGAIADDIRDIVAAGCREVVLTGVDITAWGNDLPGWPRLGDLVNRILKVVPGLPRLRLTSLDIAEVDDALLKALAVEERLMPHLHLSLQAGDAMILKRMRRRHTPHQAVRFCEKVRRLRPDIVFGADLIAGFPTETDEMFDNTLAHVTDCGLTWLHVFPYSERPGTPAAKMPAVTRHLRKQRAARLRDRGAMATAAFLDSCVGTTATVLVESPGRGRSEHFAPVATPQDLAAGGLHTLEITGSDGTRLLAGSLL